MVCDSTRDPGNTTATTTNEITNKQFQELYEELYAVFSLARMLFGHLCVQHMYLCVCICICICCTLNVILPTESTYIYHVPYRKRNAKKFACGRTKKRTRNAWMNKSLRRPTRDRQNERVRERERQGEQCKELERDFSCSCRALPLGNSEAGCGCRCWVCPSWSLCFILLLCSSVLHFTLFFGISFELISLISSSQIT